MDQWKQLSLFLRILDPHGGISLDHRLVMISVECVYGIEGSNSVKTVVKKKKVFLLKHPWLGFEISTGIM